MEDIYRRIRRLIVVSRQPPKEWGTRTIYPAIVRQKLEQGFQLVSAHERPTPGVGTYYVYELVKEVVSDVDD